MCNGVNGKTKLNNGSLSRKKFISLSFCLSPYIRIFHIFNDMHCTRNQNGRNAAKMRMFLVGCIAVLSSLYPFYFPDKVCETVGDVDYFSADVVGPVSGSDDFLLLARTRRKTPSTFSLTHVGLR